MTNIKKILILFLVTRVLIFVIGVVSVETIHFQPSFPYSKKILKPLAPDIINRWGNFDGVHYLTIADKGYVGTESIQVFFPGYPMLSGVVGRLAFNNNLIAGLIISNISFFLALILLYKITEKIENSKIAFQTVIFLTLFPTSYYFSSMYSESLFLLLITASVYYFQRKRRYISAIFGGLASATRVVGILLLPYLLIEIFTASKKLSTRIKNSMIALISTFGLLFYMVFLKKEFNDPLFFIKAQSTFGLDRDVGKIILLPQVIWRYMKILFTTPLGNHAYYVAFQEIAISAIIIILLSMAILKKEKLSYIFYALVSFLLPTLTGTFLSIPRFALVMFPIFIWASKYIPKKRWLITSIILWTIQVANLIMFISGKWIS